MKLSASTALINAIKGLVNMDKLVAAVITAVIAVLGEVIKKD